jgi:V/A-type H+/Na+-transporting ATPase subunit E
MNNEEKLQHIYEVAVKDADRERKAILKAYGEGLEKEYQRHVSEREQRIRSEAEAQIVLVKRQMNKEFSAESLEIKHSLSEKRKELKEVLFNEVNEKLLAFKKTSDYVPYLAKLIEKAKEFAGDDELAVYVDRSDANLVSEIESASGIRPMVSDEELFGGIEAKIESKNILIDRSWKSQIEELKENYSFEGGADE